MYYQGGLSLVVETNHLDYLDYFIVEEELGQVKQDTYTYMHITQKKKCL